MIGVRISIGLQTLADDRHLAPRQLTKLKDYLGGFPQQEL